MHLVGGFDSESRTVTSSHVVLDLLEVTFATACPFPFPVVGASAVALTGYERSPSLRTICSVSFFSRVVFSRCYLPLYFCMGNVTGK